MKKTSCASGWSKVQRCWLMEAGLGITAEGHEKIDVLRWSTFRRTLWRSLKLKKGNKVTQAMTNQNATRTWSKSITRKNCFHRGVVFDGGALIWCCWFLHGSTGEWARRLADPCKLMFKGAQLEVHSVRSRSKVWSPILWAWNPFRAEW